MSIISGSFTTLEKALDFSSRKQQVISSNIANADTPNYKARDVSFKQMLEDETARGIEAKRTNDKHIAFRSTELSEPAVYVKNNRSYNHNGNSVDLDKEMSELATNQIYYNALTDRINSKYQSLQSVIKGGQ